MNRPRTWVQGFLLLAVIVAVAGWFLGVSPRLDDAASIAAQAESVRQTNETTRATIAQLRQQAEDLPELRTQLAEVQDGLPPVPELGSLLSEFESTSSDVTVSNFTFGLPTQFVPSTAEAAAAASSNLISIGVQFNASGSFDQILDYIAQLQRGDRVFLVTSLSFSSEEGGASNSASIGGDVFVLIDPRVTPVVAPSVEGGTPAETPAEGDVAAPEDGGTAG